MATTRSKIVAELIGTAGTIDNAKLTGSISNDKLAGSISNDKLAGSISADKLAPGAGGTDWAHTDRIQSSNFNAISNKGYYVNTSSAAVTVTLPSTPADGDVISLVDVTGSANSNIILINPNGKKINGNDYDFEIASIRSGVQLTYSGSTYGWIATESVNDYSSLIIVVGRPIITSFANNEGEQYFQDDGNTITITGRNFKADATVKFIDTDGTEYTSSNVGVGSIPLTLTATIPTGMTAAVNATDDKDPFDIKVTNAGDNKFGILENLLEWLPTPTFSVNGTTSGVNFGRLLRGDAISSLILNGSPVAVSATSLDSDDTVTIATSPQTGTLPAGISISSSGTFSGTLTGPAAGKTSHTFTLRATAVSGSESKSENSPSYTIDAFGTRVESVSPTIFDGSAGFEFTITGKGFSGTPAVKTAGNGGVKFVGTGVGNSFTQNAASITVDSDTQMRVTTSANISPTDVGSGLDIHVSLDDGDDSLFFQLSHETSPVFITAPLGITAGTPTTLTNTITSALRGQALTGTDFVIPAATDANGGSIASYALNTAFSATGGADISWLSFNPSNRQITGTVPSSYITGGGSITVPIRITDNAGNTLDQDYTITVDAQGFSYPLGITHSAMFDGSSSYLYRNFGSGNRQTFTWSGWAKRSQFTSTEPYCLFGSYQPSLGDNDNSWFLLSFYENTLFVNGWGSHWRRTQAVYRDPSAWYHVVLAVNSTLAAAQADDRIKVYVNGSEIVNFQSKNNPAQYFNFAVNVASTEAHGIGDIVNFSTRYYFNGYMANIDFIDGQALSADYFGKTQDGIWVAKTYDGTTNEQGDATNVEYGTNGFKLTFADSGDLGKDTAPTSGSNVSNHTAANNWTNN